MSTSLLEQLPEIVARGRRQAEALLGAQGADGPPVGLCTREWVRPPGDRPAADPGGWANRLIRGDNLHAMAALLAGDARTPSLRGRVDLIYADPPFDSHARYHARVDLPGDGPGDAPLTIAPRAYDDAWAGGTAAYLAMMVPRLVLMRELLAETGSLYLHLDWHASHLLRLIADEVFGRANFVNEIVWHYPDKLPSGTASLPKNHDVILCYARRRSRRRHAPLLVEREEPLRQARKVWNAALGRWQGYERDAQGRRVTALRTVRMADDVWRIPAAPVVRGAERWNYPTQKPAEILRRILAMSSSPGDLVADFHAGSGTTAAVAEAMGRRWISVDAGRPACLVARRRLVRQGAGPFLVQTVGEPQDGPAPRLVLARVTRRRGDPAAGPQDGQEALAVALHDYAPAESQVTDLTEADRQRVQAVLRREPLVLIDAWAIDPDYDGRLFRAAWQTCRDRPSGRGPVQALAAQAELVVPGVAGPRRICVRAIDVFGGEAEAQVTLPA